MDWLTTLADQDNASERSLFLRNQLDLLPEDASEQMHAAVLKALYLDLTKASRLAEASVELADLKGGNRAKAFAARSQAHVAYLVGKYEEASSAYRKALHLFEAEGNEDEVGRTLSSGLQALSYQGMYVEAETWAQRAGAIFEKLGDVLRLARLDTNIGNIYFRQDRPGDALARYHRALEGFEQCGEPRDIGAAYSNLAVCSTSLGRFSDSLYHYARAREHCAKHGLTNLTARADYNIAFLHYLRGDYNEARRLYAETREHCSQAGDGYHAALCDLDEAELFLELNLTREGEALARRSAKSFEALKMPYEQAKGLVSLAIALTQRSDWQLADKTLRQARRLFAKENNAVWPSLVDQLRAVLAFHTHQYDRAERLSTSASRGLAKAAIPGRAAWSQILLARLWLRAGFADRARVTSREALERPGADSSPGVRFHARLIEAEIHEIQGRVDQAVASYELARKGLEEMRSRLDSEDLRISILNDKLAVYESLVTLYLDSATQEGRRAAFACVQQAKSRSLADHIRSENNPQTSELRKDLGAIYRQIELADLTGDSATRPGRIAPLHDRARELELEIASSQQPNEFNAGMDTDLIQASLHEGEALLEYYESRGVLYLFIVCKSDLQCLRLGSPAPIRQSWKLLQFQMGKVRFQKELDGEILLSSAISYHLKNLHRLLIGAALEKLSVFKHLVIAPHRNLHGIPFAALLDGDDYLTDQFGLSFVPSGEVFARCRGRERPQTGDWVVFAVPDERAPGIAEEAEMLAQILPDAKVMSGSAATLKAFQKLAPEAGVLHIAAHGHFRRDNPLYSSIDLADGQLTMMDLNVVRLNASLLTLSGCNTGSSVPVGGDELLGLMRCCLSAGARSLLLSLWEIDDNSAMQFMTCFYRKLKDGLSLSQAISEAVVAVRHRFPHPYHWAPFILVGDPDPIRLGGGGSENYF